MSMVRRVLWELWLPVLLVAIWWFASANSTNFYFPPLADIMDEFVDIWFFEGIRTEIWPSVQRLSGIGNGRCPTRCSERACRLAALASSKRSVTAPRGCRAAPARARSPRTAP